MSLRVFAIAICAFVCALGSTVAAQTSAGQPPAIVAQRASVEDPGHAPIPVAIWASPGGAPAPLIVISHGNGGFLDSHADTAQALAQAGFVVVALTHPGDNARDESELSKAELFVDRPRHVSRAIDYMFDRWEGRARLVRDKVGVFGFSAGGTTALIAIGGVLNLDQISDYCAQSSEMACTLFAKSMPAGGDAAAAHGVADPRIAAAVVAAPGLGFAFAPSGLSKVSVPVQLWSGEADETAPYKTNAAVVRRLLPHAPEFHSVRGAEHYSFLRPCAPDATSELCKDAEGFDRAAFHEMFNRKVAVFFHEHLDEAGAEPKG